MDFSQILGLFFLGFFLVLTDRLLDKSSLRFAPKKAGPRNAARAKPRQLSITKVSVSTPPSSQQQQQSQSNGENLSQLLGSTMSPAQLLRQSQMTSTIEEDDELESDAGPSNNVPAINHGIETPPATQQRSPWATRMRSSIPLPLDPDTLNSILGTTNRSTNNNSANTPAPTEQTITKQPTFLARKVTATQVKQVFDGHGKLDQSHLHRVPPFQKKPNQLQNRPSLRLLKVLIVLEPPQQRQPPDQRFRSRYL